jgi:hypothetical protein
LGGIDLQDIGVCFFNVNIHRKTACFEEKIHRKVEEGREKKT